MHYIRVRSSGLLLERRGGRRVGQCYDCALHGSGAWHRSQPSELDGMGTRTQCGDCSFPSVLLPDSEILRSPLKRPVRNEPHSLRHFYEAATMESFTARFCCVRVLEVKLQYPSPPPIPLMIAIHLIVSQSVSVCILYQCACVCDATSVT